MVTYADTCTFQNRSPLLAITFMEDLQNEYNVDRNKEDGYVTSDRKSSFDNSEEWQGRRK